ncbi:hypothetical protein [Ruminiclostridium cellobioparum]|uniref:Uncharacterized protein n=1 Tax=Ruminiclostridium cellobioparum subsp. termitidis CT1112 TaxID=1195236 RepID=S0FII5_RUMCE|nr:hypothetical protein [Ruminiclostridium cellobioparum]EMS71477.1 hypothetical protein CTER_2616 [Ruminiclostridium cellobioparum subsp. termitidis CT1112]
MDETSMEVNRMLHLPRTDGSRVYWSKVASLSIDELMNMLTDETGSENKN